MPARPSTDQSAPSSSPAELGELGIGTWEWGDRAVWGYGAEYGESEVRAAFEAAIGAGIRLFDTAEIYGGGESERLLGQFVRASGMSSGSGASVVSGASGTSSASVATGAPIIIATKFFPYPARLLQRGSLIGALRSSLERLGVDHLELYQIHWPLPIANSVWADELAEAVEAGLTRRVGVSNFGARQLRKMHAALLQRGVQLSTNQIQYSLVHRQPERNGVLAACQQLGIGVIAYSPLGSGLLGGRYDPDHPPALRRRLQAARKLERAWRVLPILRRIAEAHGRTPAQVALNWLICHGAVPIPGAKSADQARQNAGAIGWRLAPDELAQLDRISAEP